MFLNKTQTIANGLQGIPDSFLSYGGPLKADLRADAAFTAAQLVNAPAFDPVTADWSKIYTGFPQPQLPTIGLDNLAGVGTAKVCFLFFCLFEDGGVASTSRRCFLSLSLSLIFFFHFLSSTVHV